MTEAMHQVLIVEDDPALQKRAADCFSRPTAYRVVATSFALGGIRDARLYNPEVVIVDLGLPDRDGIEVIRGIRTWSAMPVVVLSQPARPNLSGCRHSTAAPTIMLSNRSAPPKLLARGARRPAAGMCAETYPWRSSVSGTWDVDLTAPHRPPVGRRRASPHAARVPDIGRARRANRKRSSRRPPCCAMSGGPGREDSGSAPGVHRQSATQARSRPGPSEAHHHRTRARLPIVARSRSSGRCVAGIATG